MKRIIGVILFITSFLFPLTIMESCDTGLENETDGQIMFWSDFDGAPIDVYVSNNFVGTIGQFFTSTPTCGANGAVTVTMAPDTYQYHAEEENGPGSTGKTWDGTVTIRPNSCGALNLSM